MIDAVVVPSIMSMTRGSGRTRETSSEAEGVADGCSVVWAGGAAGARAAPIRCMTRFSASIETATRTAARSSGRR
ncbi:hypothetical protein D3C87_1825040 [compost metagenome]